MKRVALIITGLAFAGAVAARAIDDPALGPGAGALVAPVSVTVCPIESLSC